MRKSDQFLIFCAGIRRMLSGSKGVDERWGSEKRVVLTMEVLEALIWCLFVEDWGRRYRLKLRRTAFIT